MRVGKEKARPLRWKQKTSFDRMGVGFANRTQESKEVASNGRTKLNTYKMEVSISHCIHTEVSQESDIWQTTEGYRRNIKTVMRV